MAGNKFQFNPETLRYETIRFSFREKVISMLPFLLSVIAVSFFSIFLLNNKFTSPRAIRLISQQEAIEMRIQFLEQEIESMNNSLNSIQKNDDQIYRTYFEVSPLPSSLRDAGFGGHTSDDIFRSGTYKEQLALLNTELDKISKKLVVQSRSFDDVLEMARNKEKRIAARPAIQPVSIRDLTRFGSAFGMRMHPILKTMKMHEGIDLTAPKGTFIYATADGLVLESGYTRGGYGNKIVIDHGYGYKTLYGHCDQVLVRKGHHVKRGDIIGTVGNTGLSVAPHLHYEVIVNGQKVNPVHYYANDLSASEFERMISLLSDADPSFDIN